MKKIYKETFQQERALYHEHDLLLIECTFQGVEDGESALKESNNIILEKNLMDLRYPLWHVDFFQLDNCIMTNNCRAPIWYSTIGVIKNCVINGVKAIRETNDIKIFNTQITSAEFGWKSKNIYLENCTIESEYAFLDSNSLNLKDIKFKGKYSFQYVDDLVIENSYLDTKDAFWHANNVIIKNSVIVGEYLGWYSKNITFINCKIKGTQPLCYCENLTLIDCEMEDADLSFEYSSVNAKIKGHIISIKNPLKGLIEVDSCDEIIFANSKYASHAKVQVNNKDLA